MSVVWIAVAGLVPLFLALATLRNPQSPVGIGVDTNTPVRHSTEGAS